MSFKIWDNSFGGYMRDVDGSDAIFGFKADADHAIEHFICSRDRQDEWLCRLDVIHADANICYHLGAKNVGDNVLHYPKLLPMDFRVAKSHWNLLAADGTEMNVGMAVRTFDGETCQLIEKAPPHKMASSGKVTCVDAQGRKNWWGASVIGGFYKYEPPEDARNSEALCWASAEQWERLAPSDLHRPRELVLPPPCW